MFILKSPIFLERVLGSQDDPLSSQNPTQDFVDRGHLDKENDI